MKKRTTKTEQVKTIVNANKYDLNAMARAISLVDGVVIEVAEDGIDIFVYAIGSSRCLGLIKVRKKEDENCWYISECKEKTIYGN